MKPLSGLLKRRSFAFYMATAPNNVQKQALNESYGDALE